MTKDDCRPVLRVVNEFVFFTVVDFFDLSTVLNGE